MIDYLLVLMVLTLVTLGILFIYSSSINSDGISVTNEYIKQIVWASIGLVFMIFINFYDYRRTESIAVYLYIALILLLIYTRKAVLLFFKHYGNRWVGTASSLSWLPHSRVLTEGAGLGDLSPPWRGSRGMAVHPVSLDMTVSS